MPEMKTRKFLTIIYILFAFNALCEAACLPDCDSDKVLTILQIEDCEHVSCELSHENQHNYTKDDSSDKSKQVKAYISTNVFDINNLSIESKLKIDDLNHDSMTHQFSHIKKIIVFNKLKIFSA